MPTARHAYISSLKASANDLARFLRLNSLAWQTTESTMQCPRIVFSHTSCVLRWIAQFYEKFIHIIISNQLHVAFKTEVSSKNAKKIEPERDKFRMQSPRRSNTLKRRLYFNNESERTRRREANKKILHECEPLLSWIRALGSLMSEAVLWVERNAPKPKTSAIKVGIFRC